MNWNRREFREQKYLYCAYGSNLNWNQMEKRCPYSAFYGTGYLKNWEMVFNGAPQNAHATIRRKKGSMVPVALWRVSEFDLKQLDAYEGYPRYYFKQNVMVELEDERKKAMVYIMDTSRMPGIPSDTYVNTILDGYDDCGFDSSVFYDFLDASNERIN